MELILEENKNTYILFIHKYAIWCRCLVLWSKLYSFKTYKTDDWDEQINASQNPDGWFDPHILTIFF